MRKPFVVVPCNGVDSKRKREFLNKQLLGESRRFAVYLTSVTVAFNRNLPITPRLTKTRDGATRSRSQPNSFADNSNGYVLILWSMAVGALTNIWLYREGDDEEPEAASANDTSTGSEHVAIVGVGCRLPGGVSTAERFWEILEEQVDAVRRIPADRWEAQNFQQAKVASQLGGFLGANEVENFDSEFFGIAKNEADLLDPQQRCERIFVKPVLSLI